MIVRSRCEWCGERFEQSTGKQRFCTDAHRYAARDRGRHVERGTKRAATCRRCGDQFTYESTTKPRVYCFECRPIRAEAA